MFVVAVACSPIRAANPPPAPAAAVGRTLTRADAIVDVDTLFHTLEDVHPDLYAVWPRDSAAAARKQLVADLPPSLSRSDWWVRLSPVVARFGDGHTNLGHPADDIRAARALLVFPPSVDADDDRQFVVSAPIDRSLSLQRGDRLVAVNGRNADSLMSAWMREFSGEADAFRAAQVAGTFRDLLFMHAIEPPWTLTIARGEDEQTVLVPGITRDSLAALARQRRTMLVAAPEPNFTYRVLQPGVGYMNFYSLDGELGQFKTHVAAMFAQVAKDSAHTLIVDLRTNGGGDSRLGDEFLRYITTKSFRGSARKEWKMSAEYRAFLRSLVRPPLSLLPLQYMMPLAHQLLSGPDGKIVPFEFSVETPQRAEPFFSGAVCALTGSGTFSSAVDLADAIKTYHLATIVGEETGGRPNSFGEVYWFRLPRSGFLVSVSSARFVRASGDTTDHRGVMPDSLVQPTAAQRRSARDVVLDRAIDCPSLR